MLTKFRYFLELIRPSHAIKSLIVFAPLFFTFEINLDLYITTLVAFVLFYLMSSTIYIFVTFSILIYTISDIFYQSINRLVSKYQN